jgi:hypothetical protein
MNSKVRILKIFSNLRLNTHTHPYLKYTPINTVDMERQARKESKRERGHTHTQSSSPLKQTER